ncbi:MAG TPA: hypothetical protein VKW08_01535 [Xanthobacteraceae bacterium]|jgi:hypothetical protein|nr:hypothetical protein [Xanthobacteraceae bacterium]
MAVHRPHAVHPKKPMRHREKPYHEVQKKIGEELRKLLKVPAGLPHRLLAVLMQMNEPQSEERDSDLK